MHSTSNISAALLLATEVAREAESSQLPTPAASTVTSDVQGSKRFTRDGLIALNRLLTAAVISSRFCQQLLTDPRAAIAAGYHGETFTFSDSELALLSAIQAETLAEFAQAVAEEQS